MSILWTTNQKEMDKMAEGKKYEVDLENKRDELAKQIQAKDNEINQLNNMLAKANQDRLVLIGKYQFVVEELQKHTKDSADTKEKPQ